MDFLYKLYNSTFKLGCNGFAKYIGKASRFFIYLLANLLAPLIYRVKFSLFKPKEITTIPVSLTSFPDRIKKIHLVIYSILSQEIRPQKIYLWLSIKQFPNLEGDLPNSLLKLKEHGLIIEFVEDDLRSYKKFYHLLQKFGKQSFITFDDDIFYHSKAITNLIHSHKKSPEYICANRVLEIKNGYSYNEWPVYFGAAKVSFGFLPTGCGGVLYPKDCFGPDILDSNVFSTICKDADDIWLNVNTFINNRQVIFTGFNLYFLNVFNLSSNPLHHQNVDGGNNDLVIKKVKSYYKDKVGFDVFER